MPLLFPDVSYPKHQIFNKPIGDFPKWQEAIPGLEKSRVCILDNDNDTVEKVREAGFSAILFPSTTDTRPEDVTFTKDGLKALEAVHKFIDEAGAAPLELNMKEISAQERKIEVYNHLAYTPQNQSMYALFQNNVFNK